jgi:hypothetical protein
MRRRGTRLGEIVTVAAPVPVHGLQQIVSKINTTIAHEIDTCSK